MFYVLWKVPEIPYAYYILLFINSISLWIIIKIIEIVMWLVRFIKISCHVIRNPISIIAYLFKNYSQFIYLFCAVYLCIFVCMCNMNLSKEEKDSRPNYYYYFFGTVNVNHSQCFKGISSFHSFEQTFYASKSVESSSSEAISTISINHSDSALKGKLNS